MSIFQNIESITDRLRPAWLISTYLNTIFKIKRPTLAENIAPSNFRESQVKAL